ncbi:tol-pal system protein YbgF [Aliarcobacter thereius]|uniref:Tol-pal system protein YbgF n=2 Tax=Aliarcobacter thereius TaxID=544718 RepID=A0A1C0B7M9_9BACT|nr:tetratricopeptide repeat protein [Aliarcobacter thereius]OCL87839.1 tol-pal system protein YbgF [Aliarcobacter thereius]OCL94095.1 tol-pal system protein YbgF [Aliarcobacter thereius]OCL95489.1 tol-pal system protein YbgF [Aliarcobacter thereius LMG 24486]OCL99609.1 tol-pal system protein YbgF [Aliarcobacter thereius]QBF16524.1 Tol-Pal system protein YbgF [Aliarcobacter thereius LMG 24486]
MKKLLLLLVIASIAVTKEVSVYEATKESTYGLTNTEKHILKNQSNISELSSKVEELNTLVETLSNRMEGLNSVYEGDSQKLNNTTILVNENKKEIEVLNEHIKKITELINKINSEYVSSNEFKNNMQQFVTREEFEALKKALGLNTAVSPKNAQKNDLKEPKTAEEKANLMAEAKKDFSEKMYTFAIPKFEKLVEVNYKPAESNFHLGEMWFKRKKYEDAISYYKKSAILYDKASYMPTLLLNCGISFERLKDNENAKSFYKTLIEHYPKSNEAKEAKTNLNKL